MKTLGGGWMNASEREARVGELSTLIGGEINTEHLIVSDDKTVRELLQAVASANGLTLKEVTLFYRTKLWEYLHQKDTVLGDILAEERAKDFHAG